MTDKTGVTQAPAGREPLSSRGGTGRENVSVAAGAAPLVNDAEAIEAARHILADVRRAGAAGREHFWQEPAVLIACALLARDAAGEKAGITQAERAQRTSEHPSLSSTGDERREAWQPIENAPTDGTEIWAYTTDGYQRAVYWKKELSSAPDDPGHYAGWASEDGGTWPGCFYYKPLPPNDPPTHWRPLPKPPSLLHAAPDRGGEDSGA